MIFPPDICSELQRILTSVPSGPHRVRVLDDDWEFVSCRLTNDAANEVLITLKGSRSWRESRGTNTLGDEVSTDQTTSILIEINDLHVLDGASIGQGIVELVCEQLMIFTMQASPPQSPGTVRLPGWSPDF
jgi:hypothetical protein